MRRIALRVAALFAVVLLVLVSAGTGAADPTPPRPKTPRTQPVDKTPLTRVPGTKISSQRVAASLDKLTPDKDGLVRVVVELQDAPVAAKYGVHSTAPALAAGKLDLANASAKAYEAGLLAAQAKFKADVAAKVPSAKIGYSYRIVLNGVSMALHPADLEALQKVDGIKAIYPDTLMRVTLDSSISLINAPAAWAALGGVEHAGAGVKVAVIDTGIRPENPMFSGAGFSYPTAGGPWPKGDCATMPEFCNGKIIAGRHYNPPSGTGATEESTPIDIDGHGSHTAGTAVGRNGIAASSGAYSATISGVAPEAWLMVYKGLYSDGTGGASGLTSSLAAAIDDAVRDGADVISNSWGSGPGDPTGDPTAIAAENAVAAGAVVVFSAGNDGPDAGTLGRPGNTPGVITVAASTTPRTVSASVRLTASGAAPLEFTGASIGAGSSGPFVDAEGVADSQGDTSGKALNPYPPGTFTGKIVLVQRGVVARVDKSANVRAGGAIGMVLYNAEGQADTELDLHSVPTVQIQHDQGLQLKAFVAAHPDALATLSAAAASPATADVMADFSSRGPNYRPEIIKPDLAAPGVNILSAFSPQNPVSPAPFAFESGTSMSAPHVAGAAALVRQRYPNFTPAQVKSALMTTAVTQGVTLSDGTPASVFDRGAGRLDAGKAIDPGLVFDKPSLGVPGIIGRATAVITATNVAATPGTYTTSSTPPTAGASLTVTPSTFTLAPGASISLTVGINLVGAPLTDYTAGQIDFAETSGSHHAHIITWVEAVGADVPDQVSFDTRADNGTYPVKFTPNVDVGQLTLQTYGLTLPTVQRVSITQDSDRDPTTNPLDEAHGWRVFTYTLGVDTGLFRAATSNGSDTLQDVDVFVFYDANGDGHFDYDTELIGKSRGFTVDDQVTVTNPRPGLYAVGIHAYRGDGDFDLSIWNVKGNGTLQATPPNSGVQAGQEATVTLRYSGLDQRGKTYLGMLQVPGLNGQGAAIPVEVTRLPDTEMSFTAAPTAVEAGRPVTYTLTVTNFENTPGAYTATAPLPDNMRVVPDSLNGVTYDATSRTIQSSFTVPQRREAVEFRSSTSGGPSLRFIDLPTELGTTPLPQGDTGDDVGVNVDLPTGMPAFHYLGQSYTTMGLVTNGYVVPGGVQSDSDIQFRPFRLPDATRKPHPMIAPFFADLDLSAGAAGHGEWYAETVTAGPFGSNRALIVQWKDAQRYSIPDKFYTFEVVMVLETGETYFIYDNMDGNPSPSSIGAENADGTEGNSWYFNGTPSANAPVQGQTLTLDYPDLANRFLSQTVSYRARPMAVGTFTTTATLARDGRDGTSQSSASVTASLPPPQTVTLTTASSMAGYASRLNGRKSFFGEGVIWSGVDENLRLTYYGLFQTPTLTLPPNAKVTRAWVDVTGQDARGLWPGTGQWYLRLLSPSVNADFTSLTVDTAAAAPVDATIPPTLLTADLGVGRVNTFAFSADQLRLIEQRNGQPFSFRLDGQVLSGQGRQVFGWDGGAGGHTPVLHVEYQQSIIEQP
ncbi:MAG: S8 family serine peptidase [Anaerolineae bacterium]